MEGWWGLITYNFGKSCDHSQKVWSWELFVSVC
jgi:hypothetical protein